MFVPKNQLKSIACGRGNGTRFVDMQIQLEENHTIPSVKFDLMELTNIPREELSVLDTYIHKTLIPSMLNDLSNDDERKDDQTEEDEDSNNDDQTDDEDERKNGNSKKHDTMKKRPRSRRACAQEARRITKSQINKVPIVDDEDSDSADDEDVVFQNDSNSSSGDSDEEQSVSLESATESDHDDDDDSDIQTAKKSKII